MRQQREGRRDFRRRFMGLLTGAQSMQLMNSGVLSGGRQDPPAKSFLDIHADLVPLGILDGGKTAHRPAASPRM